MGEGKVCAVKGLDRLPQLRGACGGFRGGIEPVSQNRPAHGAHVDPDLVGPAGEQTKPDQAAALRCFQKGILRDGGFARFARFPPQIPGIGTADRELDAAAGRIGDAVHRGKIDLFRLRSSQSFSQQTAGPGAFGKEDDARIYILAGAPKAGKSFLMEQIAYHVSTGKPFWDLAVRQGTVLYLALEDLLENIQERMYRMFGPEGSDKLRFASWPCSIGNGLTDRLYSFLKKYEDTQLIIIDTFQCVFLLVMVSPPSAELLSQ